MTITLFSLRDGDDDKIKLVDPKNEQNSNKSESTSTHDTSISLHDCVI